MSVRGPSAPSLIPPDLLLKAYAHGLFPMAPSADSKRIDWFDPEWRGILPLDAFHIPKRLARTIRSSESTIRIDTAFETVMRECAAPVDLREFTWISAVIRDSYLRLHQLGHAHSVEVWADNELIGGLYGVSLGAAFFGESMFSRRRDASKIALVHLVTRLRSGGYQLLDAQFMTEHLRQFGAREIPRAEYLEMLRSALEFQANFYELGAAGAATSGRAVLQDTTQTS